MERRDFLTLFASAAAAAGVSATPLAGAVPAPEPPLDGPEDLDAYVERRRLSAHALVPMAVDLR